jgi:excisionase family DNA binding protein
MSRVTVTQKEAAAVLGLNPKTVRKLVEVGSLRPITVGPGMRPRFSIRELERFACEGAPAEEQDRHGG